MAQLVVGPSSADLVIAAERVVAGSFEPIQLQRGRYLAKVDAARKHLAGERQESIIDEANLREIDPRILAETIDAKARNDEADELARVRLLLRIREAAKLPPAEALTFLRAALAERGLSF